MASVAVHLKSKHKSPYAILRSPAFTSRRLLSSKSNNDENNENARNSSSFSFSDLKASLKQPQEQQRQPQSIPRKPFSFSQDPKPEKISSLEEIKKNLSNFRARYTAPEPLPPSADSRSNSDKFSFQKLYPRNATNKSDEAKITIDAIRENLRTIKIAQNEKSRNVSNAFSLSKYRESLKLSPKGDNDSVQGGNVLIGGTSENLPWPVFGKEMSEKEKEEEDKLGGDMRKAQLVKAYTESELGAKLRTLRPEGVEKKKDGFSLKELNERLIKLRELEEKESESRGSGASSIEGLRDHLSKIKFSEDEKTRRSSFQRFDILSPLGGTPSFMQAPPKENLVEKYFHPDNMSSAEKLKLELKRMREEFKKHETDCGSEPVQIAQLTTEINHLASVLHKKDKHSRKGLLAKVQKRKSLLKYLRRTDWESYCFVLSRLGLRDNPDYKN